MLWAMGQSIVTAFRWFRDIFDLNLPSKILIILGILRWTTIIAVLLVMIEIVFFASYTKLWLKRIPNYDHDILNFWLTIVNFVSSVYFGSLQTYSILATNNGETGFILK